MENNRNVPNHQPNVLNPPSDLAHWGFIPVLDITGGSRAPVKCGGCGPMAQSGYPLVNIQKTMENHHAIHGKINYFYRMVPPSDVCWFINPISYSYICHKP